MPPSCQPDTVLCAIRDFIEVVRPADVWPGFLLTVLATLIGAVVGAFVAWLFARNLAKAERDTREKDREQDRKDRAAERAQEKKDREVERLQAKADRSEEVAQERTDRQAERDDRQRQSEEEFNARRAAEYEDRMDIQFEQIVRVSHRYERLMAKAGIPDQDLITRLADEYYGAVESAIVYARDEDRTVLIALRQYSQLPQLAGQPYPTRLSIFMELLSAWRRGEANVDQTITGLYRNSHKPPAGGWPLDDGED